MDCTHLPLKLQVHVDFYKILNICIHALNNFLSHKFRFVFMKELLYFCLLCRPRVPLSCEAVAVSEGCLHQLWRGTYSSSDKGKDTPLGTLAAVSPA